MGLVAYRDIGDEYVTRAFNLTTDIQDLYADLLKLRAQGGGDWPESVNEALESASPRCMDARAGQSRMIFLVGDAPPHMDYAQDIKYPDVMRMALTRGITVNAVQAGNARDTERVWREIAQTRQGRLYPDPAGRRPGPDHRDAIDTNHRTAAAHQPHRDPLWYAPAQAHRAYRQKGARWRPRRAAVASDWQAI